MRGLFASGLAAPGRAALPVPVKGWAGGPRTGARRARSGRHVPSRPARLSPVCRRLLLCWVAAAAPLALADDFQTPAIAAAELMARQGKPDAPLVVDVRPNGEYKSGHVAGALNIPYDKMDKHLDQLTQAPHGVVLYCTQGHRTRQAEQTLIENDVPNVFHLQGGLGAWRQAGYPIHTGWGP